MITHKIMSYNDIIYDLIQCCDGGHRHKNVTHNEENPVYSINFWKLYRNKESKLWEIFPKGSVWKHPRFNEWRFYFNENVPEFRAKQNRLRMIDRLKEREIMFCPNKAKNLNEDDFLNYYVEKMKAYSWREFKKNQKKNKYYLKKYLETKT